MKARSMEMPEAVEIIGSGHTVMVVMRQNATELETEEGGYEYDEVSVATKNRPGLKAEVESDISIWIEKAENQYAQEHPDPNLTLKERIERLELVELEREGII